MKLKAKAYKPTLCKIHKLIHLIDLADEELDEFEYQLNVCDNEVDGRAHYKTIQKRIRLKQKLRKQMAKYLEEKENDY